MNEVKIGPLSTCSCLYPYRTRVPCWHVLAVYIEHSQELPATELHPRWHANSSSNMAIPKDCELELELKSLENQLLQLPQKLRCDLIQFFRTAVAHAQTHGVLPSADGATLCTTTSTLQTLDACASIDLPHILLPKKQSPGRPRSSMRLRAHYGAKEKSKTTASGCKKRKVDHGDTDIASTDTATDESAAFCYATNLTEQTKPTIATPSIPILSPSYNAISCKRQRRGRSSDSKRLRSTYKSKGRSKNIAPGRNCEDDESITSITDKSSSALPPATYRFLGSRLLTRGVKQVQNTKSDGNCGFRALAVALVGDEERWRCVKLSMLRHLKMRNQLYQDWIGYDVVNLRRILENMTSPCLEDHWFLSPDCCQLAADTFNIPVAHYDAINSSNDTLYLPSETQPGRRCYPIILCLVHNNHYVNVECIADSQVKWPRFNIQHKPICCLHGLQNSWVSLFNDSSEDS